jgi:hypothetical protein
MRTRGSPFMQISMKINIQNIIFPLICTQFWCCNNLGIVYLLIN